MDLVKKIILGVAGGSLGVATLLLLLRLVVGSEGLEITSIVLYVVSLVAFIVYGGYSLFKKSKVIKK